MTPGRVRRPLTALLGAVVVVLAAGCGGGQRPGAAECIKAVDESGEPTDACLPLAPESDRVDLATPTFSNPTAITNRLHPTSLVDQTIYGGHVEGEPFRTEVTRLPQTKPIEWRGGTIDTAVIQYVAYLDGRIHEVALDWYAQADDGSVWYFGEDVFNYEDGEVADTDGTWIASDETPAAMIMPANPKVGNVYRPEDAPGVVFEEVRVEKVDLSIPGPSGTVSGAIEVSELHMDGKRENKIFAPGYGEFSTGNPAGDLEAVSLAVPTDSRQGPAPAEFGALSTAVESSCQAVADEDAEAMQAITALNAAWQAARTKRIPPQLESQMTADLDVLNAAIIEEDWDAAQAASLRVAQNETDVRLLHHRVIDVDLARLQLWTRQLPVDVAADDVALVLANVAALERVWERTRHTVNPAGPVDAALQEVRDAADAEDLAVVDRAAATLNQAVTGLHVR
jgi:hypothetical protein